MNKPIEPLFDPLHAEQIERYHTFPHLHKQNLLDHCLRVARIVLAIWPDCPRHILIHCIVHDFGEMGGGDPPMYAKRNYPPLKQMHDMVERNTHLSMCLPWYLPPPQELTEFEKLIFKLAEAIEIFEWSWYEFNMGNRYAEIAIAVHRTAILEKAALIEQVDKALIPEGVNVTTMLLRASNYYERRDKVESDIVGNSRGIR